MMKSFLFALAIGATLTSASAAPLLRLDSPAVSAAITQQAKVVCEANGVCYRPPGRVLVPKWVYGDGAFYGPYTGPGNYGPPGKHYGWSFFGVWW